MPRRRDRQLEKLILSNAEVGCTADQVIRSIFPLIRDGLVIQNGNAEITAVNPAAERLLGLAAVDLIGQPLTAIVGAGKLIHEDGSEFSREVLSTLDTSRTGTPLRDVVLGIYRTDGTLVWLALDSQPLIAQGASAPYAVATLLRDITGSKQIERDLAAREQEFRSLAETSPDFIVRYDHEGRHLYLNGRLLKLLGLASAEEVIGKRPGEVWTDGRFAELEQAAVRAVESGSQVDIELVQPVESDAFRYHQIFIVPERDVSGQIVGTIAFGREITAIRKTSRKLMRFIDNLPGMAYTFRLSPDGHACFPFISPSVKKFYGLKPEDVQDDFAPLHSFWHPDDRKHIEAAAAESARTMLPFRTEARVCRPGQPECWLEARALPEREADGSILWHGLMLDITERKQAEALLVQREREFRTLAESLPDNIVRYNREGGTVYVNPGLERTLGDRAAAMIGTTPREYHPDGSYEDYAQLLDAVLASGEAGELEKILLAPDGNVSVHQIRMAPERGENGEVVGVLAIGRDITERKQAEEALRASEQKFRSLAENMPFVLVRYDREGRRTYVNPSVERNFGFEGEQVIGKTLPEMNPLRIPTVETYQRALKHTLATGERSEFEMQVSVASGDVRIGNTVIVAERAVDGEISGAITIGRDITQLKQAEQQLRELTAHLQTVREEEKAHLAREIHDDLGSTLAALKLRLSHLLDFELSEDMKKTPLFARLKLMSPMLENAIAATRRIVADMRPDVLDNLGLLAALKWQAEQFNKHSGIGCRIVCTDAHGCTDCSRCEYPLDNTVSINLFRIFQEVLTNVARHSGASSVEAEYRPANNEVLLSISDNGCGLPEGHTVAATSYGIRGMRERVGQLGGEIVFDTPPGGGLRVTVRVPLSVAGRNE